MSKTKAVKVDIELLTQTKTMYESQIENKISLLNSQIVNMALAHVLGKHVDVTTQKNKIKIKCN